MEKLLLSEVIEACQGSFGYPSDSYVTNITNSTDKVVEGSVYVAIKGERFDGHDFVLKAMEKGAIASITNRAIDGAKCIIVDDTGNALLEIAGYYKDKYKPLTVGVTGSVGKTSTKDIIALVLSKKYNTHKTFLNRNNAIGVPETIFNITNETEASVIEMGMNHSGEISVLSLIVKPDISVITNVGYSHIENLGSRENILKAKLEILDGASETAPIVLSKDDKLLSQLTFRDERRVMYHSISDETADVYAKDICVNENDMTFSICYNSKEYLTKMNCLGEHNIKNALCAFCVGVLTGVNIDDIIKAIYEFKSDGIRQNIIEKDGMIIFSDCYNASPDSINSALKTVAFIKNSKRKIAVLGDMFELGDFAKELHLAVGKDVYNNNFDFLFSCGDMAKYYVKGAIKSGFLANNTKHFNDKKEIIDFLKGFLRSGDTILVKASRGMKFEDIINSL